jgi:hypothetical protein
MARASITPRSKPEKESNMDKDASISVSGRGKKAASVLLTNGRPAAVARKLTPRAITKLKT